MLVDFLRIVIQGHGDSGRVVATIKARLIIACKGLKSVDVERSIPSMSSGLSLA
jgi:hypothetical protein